jgi:DNA-binding NarL/FixJ family response regulator
MPMAKRVLVVDDHPAVALALRVAFRAEGHFEVADSAATAAEGLRKLDAYDAVLLDLHLPDLAGVELVEAFRRHRPGVPLVLHTAAEDMPEIDALRGLVDAIAPKSRIDDLLDALARVTAG